MKYIFNINIIAILYSYLYKPTEYTLPSNFIIIYKIFN